MTMREPPAGRREPAGCSLLARHGPWCPGLTCARPPAHSSGPSEAVRPDTSEPLSGASPNICVGTAWALGGLWALALRAAPRSPDHMGRRNVPGSKAGPPQL